MLAREMDLDLGIYCLHTHLPIEAHDITIGLSHILRFAARIKRKGIMFEASLGPHWRQT